MIKIVGHRGAKGYAPENTLLSFQTAINLVCNRAELDVRLSKDNEIIVIHDEEVSRVTNGIGLVKEMTLIEIKELNCLDNQKIPTLQEVVDLCKNKIDLQIELKAEGTPKLVNQLILKNDLEDNVVITSFDSKLLYEIKNLNPKLRVGLLLKEISAELWELTEEIPLDLICPKYDLVTKELVTKAHELGKTVYAYHVNEKEIGDNLMALGVDEIGTDFPKLFINSN